MVTKIFHKSIHGCFDRSIVSGEGNSFPEAVSIYSVRKKVCPFHNDSSPIQYTLWMADTSRKLKLGLRLHC